MPGSVINSCLLAELMSINSAFFEALPAFFSDFSDLGNGSVFFPVVFVWLNAEPVATQIARNTINRLASVLLFIGSTPLYKVYQRLLAARYCTLLHTSGHNSSERSYIMKPDKNPASEGQRRSQSRD